MKIALLSFLSLSLLTGASLADDGKKAKRKTTKAPIKNYWDANAWENGSSSSFWRATSTLEAKKSAPSRQSVRKTSKPKQSTSSN